MQRYPYPNRITSLTEFIITKKPWAFDMLGATKLFPVNDLDLQSRAQGSNRLKLLYKLL